MWEGWERWGFVGKWEERGGRWEMGDEGVWRWEMKGCVGMGGDGRWEMGDEGEGGRGGGGR